MHKEIADRWADKLESGEYRQARGALCRASDGVEGHCCLGVLSEIAVADGIIERRYLGHEQFAAYGTPEEFESNTYATSYPPSSVIEWAGLSRENPVFKVTSWPCGLDDCKTCGNESVARPASDLNDTYKYSFDDIAKLVREQHDKI